MTRLLGPGKIAEPRYILEVRPLVRDDLAKLAKARAGTEKTTVQRFRDPHHNVARLIAMGTKTQKEVALQSGYSISRISVFMSDPAFQELVTHYRKEVTAEFREAVDDYYNLASSNMLKAERQIAEKLEEADELGETLPMRDLISISRDAADRFGYGKKQTNVNVNVDFASQLEKAIARSGKVVDLPRQPLLEEGRLTTDAVAHPQPIRRRI